MTSTTGMQNVNHFDHENTIGITGHGENIESCFENIAKNLFSLIADVENIHSLHIIAMEFEASSLELALMTWLNLLLEKCREQHVLFGDFRLRREGNLWKATVSGEPWHDEKMQKITIMHVMQDRLSVKKLNLSWEAHCVVDGRLG